MKKLVLALLVMFSVGAAVAQSKVGHVNTQKLLDTMPSRKEAMKMLQDYETKGVEELQEMQKDFQSALAVYENSRPNMPQVMIKIEEDKLMKKQQAVQDREQALQQEMQIFGQDLNQPILDRVQKAVKVTEADPSKFLGFDLRFEEDGIFVCADTAEQEAAVKWGLSRSNPKKAPTPSGLEPPIGCERDDEVDPRTILAAAENSGTLGMCVGRTCWCHCRLFVSHRKWR